MAAHEAEGLFRQAIMESGSGQTVHTRESARALTLDFLQCADLDAAHAGALRTMPVDRLLEAQRALIARRGSFPFRGTVDGIVLEHSPLQSLKVGASRHVRLLLGSNRDESSFFVRGNALEQPIGPRELQNAGMDYMRAMEAKYKEAFPGLTPAQRKVRLLTAEEYWIPTVRVAEAHAGQDGETWLYRFNYPFAKGPLAGEVPHTAELSFVWGDSNGNASHDALMRVVHEAWVGFLFGRAPALNGTPAWPRFTLAERAVMVIDRRSEVVRDPDAAERHLWDGWPS
jgi:para-nitrobenzyl esterase